jgi:hypothetical protein
MTKKQRISLLRRQKDSSPSTWLRAGMTKKQVEKNWGYIALKHFARIGFDAGGVVHV